MTSISVFAQWNKISLQEIKKFFAIIIHMSVLHKSSPRDYWSWRPIIHIPYASSVGMSRDRFLALLTMFHLNNNNAKAARGQPGYDPLFKIRPVIDTLIKISGHLHTRRTDDHQQGNMPISRVHILLCLHQKKAP